MINNTLELANISFEGENYIDSYLKYSQIIEKDIKHYESWIGKGLSAGFLGTYENNRFKEVELCLNKVEKPKLSLIQKNRIADNLIKIVEHNVMQGIKFADAKLDQIRKEPMGTMELQLTRQVKITAALVETHGLISQPVNEAFEFGLKFMDYDNTKELFEKYISVLDKYCNVVLNNFKLEIPGSIREKRILVVQKLKEINPDYEVPPEISKSSGCFVATAIYQNYNHEKVIELRLFRDEYLLQNPIGVKFVNYYYKYSPPVADYLSKRYFLSRTVKFLFLEPIIFILRKKMS